MLSKYSFAFETESFKLCKFHFYWRFIFYFSLFPWRFWLQGPLSTLASFSKMGLFWGSVSANSWNPSGTRRWRCFVSIIEKFFTEWPTLFSRLLRQTEDTVDLLYPRPRSTGSSNRKRRKFKPPLKNFWLRGLVLSYSYISSSIYLILCLNSKFSFKQNN